MGDTGVGIPPKRPEPAAEPTWPGFGTEAAGSLVRLDNWGSFGEAYKPRIRRQKRQLPARERIGEHPNPTELLFTSSGACFARRCAACRTRRGVAPFSHRRCESWPSNVGRSCPLKPVGSLAGRVVRRTGVGSLSRQEDDKEMANQRPNIGGTFATHGNGVRAERRSSAVGWRQDGWMVSRNASLPRFSES